MEKNSQRLANIAGKRYGEILSDGFKLFFESYKTLILPLAFFQVLVIVLNVFLLTDLNWYYSSLGVSVLDLLQQETLTESELNLIAIYIFLTSAILLIQNLIGAIIITTAMCSVSTYVYNKYTWADTDISDSFKSASNKKFLIVLLILGICLPLSFLVIVPSIILFSFFIFSVFTYNMKGVEKPLREARRLSKGAFWKIIGVFLINVLVISVIRFIYTSIVGFFINFDTAWVDPNSRNYGMLILYNLIFDAVDIILAPLFICLLTTLFASIKVKKDVLFQDRRPLIVEHPQPISQDMSFNIQPGSGFYCPYCGALIDSPKKFCPRCGESFSFINE
ncbi:MAG: zinc ribbon domain-containing protein [Promethearchaeota archaeon]